MRANKAPVEPIINEQADRELHRILRIYGGITVVAWLIAPLAMSFINTPASSLYKDHRFWDTISVMVLVTPFFVMIQKMTDARLRIGRSLVQERRWREAVAALDWSSAPTQRFLDRTGEAHYLMSIAYQGLGDKVKAEKMRAFVRKNRSGPWAEKLAGVGPTNPSVAQPKPSPKALGKKRRRF